MPHKHAENMMLFAEDAKEIDRPWARWQYTFPEGVWSDCVSIPAWSGTCDYRRKPRTIKIGASKFQNRCEKPRKQGQESGWQVQPDCLNLCTGFFGVTAKPLETGYSEVSAT
jgi:hypothetical protein